MDIQILIDKLKAATGPERALDGQIAEVLGWQKRLEPVIDPKTGESKQRTLWIVPAGDDFGRIPLYTSSLDAAFELAHAVAPDNVGGCTWEKGKGSARIVGGPYCQAATPILALCVAALTMKMLLSIQQQVN